MKRLNCRLLPVALLCLMTHVAVAQRPGGRARRPDTLRVGDQAADFQLKTLDGKLTVELSKLYAKRPVALIFGSYT
ncbi:MAG: hypothetical protein KDA42_05935 [Planctomycetales bacterium]|nr:hypothetical protein [Planctomycetales bacterium]